MCWTLQKSEGVWLTVYGGSFQSLLPAALIRQSKWQYARDGEGQSDRLVLFQNPQSCLHRQYFKTLRYWSCSKKICNISGLLKHILLAATPMKQSCNAQWWAKWGKKLNYPRWIYLIQKLIEFTHLTLLHCFLKKHQFELHFIFLFKEINIIQQGHIKMIKIVNE